jgi:hypothetical protein
MLDLALCAKAGHYRISNLGESTLVRWNEVDGKSKVGKDKMNFNELRKMAKRMGISTCRVKKPDIIRSVQRAESNIQCFGTQRVEYCCEHVCLWRNDCVKLNQDQQPNPGWHFAQCGAEEISKLLERRGREEETSLCVRDGLQ